MQKEEKPAELWIPELSHQQEELWRLVGRRESQSCLVPFTKFNVSLWRLLCGQARNKKYQFSWFERQPEPSRNIFVSCNELFHPHPAGKVVQEYSGK